MGFLPLAAFVLCYTMFFLHWMLRRERLEAEAQQGGRYRLTREMDGLRGRAGRCLGKTYIGG
jgi:hypothetical protein